MSFKPWYWLTRHFHKPLSTLTPNYCLECLVLSLACSPRTSKCNVIDLPHILEDKTIIVDWITTIVMISSAGRIWFVYLMNPTRYSCFRDHFWFPKSPGQPFSKAFHVQSPVLGASLPLCFTDWKLLFCMQVFALLPYPLSHLRYIKNTIILFIFY